MTGTDSPVVRREITVAAPIERAFAVFTDRFGEIKPREQNLLTAPIDETVVEGHVGGAILDRGVDGSECRWAHIRVWEPPHRLVFSWDIGPDWALVVDPENASEVEIAFAVDGPDRTRVTLEHRQLDRHGPGWQTLRGELFGENGWPLWLDRFEALAAAV